eukprot:TRINITY_DN6620_c0_g2_i3.p1 TRINITY_DN6620_c0_g2~~TRINITY_DN6620_c0_g2_i3.p1  ORF type:complete len:205 (-),score=10.92 TRINITY_DN6620_c0_g2_i3:149-763(-)
MIRGIRIVIFFFFQAEDGIRDRSPSRGLGDVYKRQSLHDTLLRTHIQGQSKHSRYTKQRHINKMPILKKVLKLCPIAAPSLANFRSLFLMFINLLQSETTSTGDLFVGVPDNFFNSFGFVLFLRLRNTLNQQSKGSLHVAPIFCRRLQNLAPKFLCELFRNVIRDLSFVKNVRLVPHEQQLHILRCFSNNEHLIYQLHQSIVNS